MVGFCHLTDSHHYHHGQKPTMVGICHGGNMPLGHDDNGDNDEKANSEAFLLTASIRKTALNEPNIAPRASKLPVKDCQVRQLFIL